MSSDMILKVTHVSKRYEIFKIPVLRLLQLLTFNFVKLYREFWALRDISFEMKRGESLGIIGQNGSGKSTLLQVIAGIVAPTQGNVEIDGTVAALLELGSGFNPQFTGRENVFMYGTLLGLTKKQVEEKLDAIVGFSEIDPMFIDQPVKVYSSGMFVRLAFSTLIHTDPDILIVDEALAVGDFAFQTKCLERIGQMRKNGLTLLFVSHDMDLVKKHCERALWLDHGRIRYQSTSPSVTAEYCHSPV